MHFVVLYLSYQYYAIVPTYLLARLYPRYVSHFLILLRIPALLELKMCLQDFGDRGLDYIQIANGLLVPKIKNNIPISYKYLITLKTNNNSKLLSFLNVRENFRPKVFPFLLIQQSDYEPQLCHLETTPVLTV